MIKHSVLIVYALAAHSFCIPDPELKALTDFASGLAKAKTMGSPSAFCEYTVSRQTNSCGVIENGYLIRSDGLVEMRIFKSYKEGPEPRPGLYKGRFSQDKWRELLSKVSKMQWDSTQEPLAMPGPDEYVSTLVLSDGKRSAAYSLAGQEKSSSIEDGLYMPGIIAQNANDTVWSLTLIREKSSIKKDFFEVKAAWKAHGKSPVSLAFPAQTGFQGCGTTVLKWREETAQGFGSISILQAEPGAKQDTNWVRADGKSVVQKSFRFKLPRANPKGKRSGKLIQTGVLVKSADSESPMSVDLYSEWFSF